MRVLGIETSSRRGSVALIEGSRPILTLSHEERSAHAERILPLIEQGLAEVGWSRATLDRVGVGVGPGSFTGVRVGIALAQGIALGLGVPLVGVGSLAAMAAAVPREVSGTRQPVLDARRDEVFVARYSAEGHELVSPRAVPRAEFALEPVAVGEHLVLVGEVLDDLQTSTHERHIAAEANLPHAVFTALIAAQATPDDLPVEPLYVREADAVKPKLPPDALVESLATHADQAAR